MHRLAACLALTPPQLRRALVARERLRTTRRVSEHEFKDIVKSFEYAIAFEEFNRKIHDELMHRTLSKTK